MLVLDNYFAINVQFVDNNNALTLRTLAVGGHKLNIQVTLYET